MDKIFKGPQVTDPEIHEDVWMVALGSWLSKFCRHKSSFRFRISSRAKMWRAVSGAECIYFFPGQNICASFVMNFSIFFHTIHNRPYYLSSYKHTDVSGHNTCFWVHFIAVCLSCQHQSVDYCILNLHSLVKPHQRENLQAVHLALCHDIMGHVQLECALWRQRLSKAEELFRSVRTSQTNRIARFLILSQTDSMRPKIIHRNLGKTNLCSR